MHDPVRVHPDRIRGKLLKWRLENYNSVDNKVYKKYQSSIISKRLNEMNAPLICVRSYDGDFIDSLMEKAKEKQKGLTQDKSMSLEASIIKEIERLYLDKNQKDPLLRDIAENISEKTNRRYNPRFIGSLVRDNLNLVTDHTREGNVVVFDSQKIEQLKRDYFIEG